MTDRPLPPAHLVGKADLKLVAYVWDCGDEYCDCTEPVIAWQWTETGRGLSQRFYRREAIWTGMFISRYLGIDPDDPDPYEELRAECERRGIGELLSKPSSSVSD